MNPKRRPIARRPHLFSEAQWCEFFTTSLSIFDPDLPQGGRIQEFLDWTAANSNSLVKRVSTELQDFPDVGEALFKAIAFKKWRFADAETASQRRQKAFDGFCERNARARNIPLIDPLTADYMRRCLAHWLPFQGISPGRFGPGAVAEHLSPLERWKYIRRYLQVGYSEPPLASSEQGLDDLFCNLPDASLSHPARLCAVPKDWNKDRLISVEPVFRTYLQHKARESLLESIHAGPLRGSAMDLYADGQRIQRSLALRGSANRRLATLDLSDASDNITVSQVLDVFPPWVCCLLEQARTPQFECQGKVYDCEIFAGMGNATTFLVETLLFAAYCRAVAWRHGIASPTVSVFGDDIVVDTRLARYLQEDHEVFFRINEEKSFIGEEDAVRESCGIYACNGMDVTPARLSGFTDNFEGVLGLSDYINEKYASHQAYQRLLALNMARAAHSCGLLPNWEHLVEGTPCISMQALPFDPPPVTRYHRDYQCLEAKVPTLDPIRESIVVTSKTWALQACLSGHLTSRRSGNSTLLDASIGVKRAPRKRWRRVLNSEYIRLLPHQEETPTH